VSSFFLPAAGSVVTIVDAVTRCSLANTGAARGVMSFKTDVRDDGMVHHVQTEPRRDASVVSHLWAYSGRGHSRTQEFLPGFTQFTRLQ